MGLVSIDRLRGSNATVWPGLNEVRSTPHIGQVGGRAHRSRWCQ